MMIPTLTKSLCEKVYEKKISNVGKCRFFGRFGTLYALASWKVEKAFLR